MSKVATVVEMEKIILGMGLKNWVLPKCVDPVKRPRKFNDDDVIRCKINGWTREGPCLRTRDSAF